MTGRRDRVLAIGLDGFEISYAEKLMAEGRLPHLTALRARSAAFLLEHPPEYRTGLEWEQFEAGLPPGRFDRSSPIAFDPDTYAVVQENATHAPFLDGLAARTVVLDSPYLDLEASTGLRGVVAWGAHDPGVVATSRPASLVEAIGPYPSPQAIYNLPWPSAERCRAMGEGLVAGVEGRSRAAIRLLSELTPDWEVFFVVSGELHSATEALWHGIDADHPLHDHPSAAAAQVALEATHVAVDRFVGEVIAAAGPDVTVVTFNMGGMGRNGSDVPTMALLPELLHRWAGGAPRIRPRPEWTDPTRPPPLEPDESWDREVVRRMPAIGPGRHLAGLKQRIPDPVRRRLRRLRRLRRERPQSDETTRKTHSVAWMPAARYADRWPAMDAFALPAFYQGRVRVNLEGRERHGQVPVARLDAVLDEIEALLRECRDPRTGEPVLAACERPRTEDPLVVASDHADLVVDWRGLPTAFDHPRLGRIGPVPYRRTGGHTGLNGVCFVAGPGIEAHPYTHRSAFDVAPTVAAFAGSPLATGRPLVEPPVPTS